MKIVATTQQGLELVLADEIKQYFRQDAKIMNRAVSFSGDVENVYKANLYLKTALRILVPLKEDKVLNEKQYYSSIHGIPWETIFSIDKTFAVQTVISNSFFRNTNYAALLAKDAIVDRFRKKFDKRPYVNPVSPQIGIHIHLQGNELDISLDSSGYSLHNRGYRVQAGEAPLNEVLAAGLIKLSGWTGETPLFDPFCGSGTILIEAARMMTNRLPRIVNDKYSFTNWIGFDKSLYTKLLGEAQDNIINKNLEIYGSDKQLAAVSYAQINAKEAQVDKLIKFSRQDFFKAVPSAGVTIITNPPYDERLKIDDAELFYKKIGDKIKKDFPNSTVWILSGNQDALKMLGLAHSKKIPLMNGPIKASFNRYETYEGSRKKNKSEKTIVME